MKLYILSIITIVLIVGCGGGDSSEYIPTTTATTLNSNTITFDENITINNLNPDRGFYDSCFELQKQENYNIFQSTKDKGYTMAFAKINLKAYVDVETIPNEIINTIIQHLNEAENLGIKLILRIIYRDSKDGKDPSLDIALSHLEQLKQTLQNHKEIISVIQAGVIGAWGEWHSFTGDFDKENPDYKQNRKEILEKLSEIFPNKYIQIRYPMEKESLYGTYEKYGDTSIEAKITQENAYNDTITSKLAHHNDCFLSSTTDMGTYESANIDFWKQYVIDESRYVPVGGETCQDTEEFTNCSTSLEELKKFNYSFLNDVYKDTVIQRWKDEGCYDEIKNNLGYRLVASSLNITNDENIINIELSIINKGFASPYVDADIAFIIKDENNTYTFLQETLDLREFYPNEVKTIKTSLNSEDIKDGNYSLYLSIGSSYSAIRLSNSNLWDVNLSSNKLTSGIIIK